MKFNRSALSNILAYIIDDPLSWTDHIDHLKGKITSLTRILYRNNHYLPLACKRTIYFGLVHSILTYYIEVYANVPKNTLNRLTIKCNRLLKILQNKPRRTPLYEL